MVYISLSICTELTISTRKNSRLCRKTPSSARERAVFSLARTAKQAILVVSSMEPDAVQTKNKPLEARSSFPTKPSVPGKNWRYHKSHQDLQSELQRFLDSLAPLHNRPVFPISKA